MIVRGDRMDWFVITIRVLCGLLAIGIMALWLTQDEADLVRMATCMVLASAFSRCADIACGDFNGPKSL